MTLHSGWTRDASDDAVANLAPLDSRTLPEPLAAPDYDRDPAFWLAVRRRMHEVVACMPYRSIGEMTSTHPETVRRYLLSGRPSVEFLGAVCEAFEVCAEWMLFGRGPRLRTAAAREHLEQATAPELVREAARRAREAHAKREHVRRRKALRTLRTA